MKCNAGKKCELRKFPFKVVDISPKRDLVRPVLWIFLLICDLYARPALIHASDIFPRSWKSSVNNIKKETATLLGIENPLGQEKFLNQLAVASWTVLKVITSGAQLLHHIIAKWSLIWETTNQFLFWETLSARNYVTPKSNIDETGNLCARLSSRHSWMKKFEMLRNANLSHLLLSFQRFAVEANITIYGFGIHFSIQTAKLLFIQIQLNGTWRWRMQIDGIRSAGILTCRCHEQSKETQKSVHL